jgi:hypothetical protein
MWIAIAIDQEEIKITSLGPIACHETQFFTALYDPLIAAL